MKASRGLPCPEYLVGTSAGSMGVPGSHELRLMDRTAARMFAELRDRFSCGEPHLRFAIVKGPKPLRIALPVAGTRSMNVVCPIESGPEKRPP